MRGLVVAGGLAAAITLGAGEARADSDWLNVGYLHSFRWGDGLGSGSGAEITYVRYRQLPLGPNGVRGIGLGAFFHFEVTGPADSLAFTLGPQVNFAPFGVEAGVEYTGGAADRGNSLGVHLGPFISIGMVAVGWHAVIPIAGASGPRGLHHALTLSFKMPFQIGGNDWAFFHGGF